MNQTIKVMNIEPYAKTAYRSDVQWVDMDPNEPFSKDPRFLDYAYAKPLPWKNTQPFPRHREMYDCCPSKALAIEQNLVQNQHKRTEYCHEACDHIAIRPRSVMTFAWWIIVINEISLVLTGGLLLAYSAVACVTLLIPEVSLPFMLHPVTFIVLFTPAIVWMLSRFYLSIFGAQPNKNPEWELNRHNGMVTINQTVGKKSLAHIRPFHEFDAYIALKVSEDEYSVTKIYHLFLKHRYQVLDLICCKVSLSDETIRDTWNYIQNYMDVSHALPDFDGRFEVFREYDPTSIEMDKFHHRPPRLYRDMDQTTWLNHIEKNIKRKI